MSEKRNKEKTKKMLYSRINAGETRGHGAQTCNGMMESEGIQKSSHTVGQRLNKRRYQ